MSESNYLPIEVPLLRHVMREAASRIVSQHGDELPSGASHAIRRAVWGGFVITRRTGEPGTIRRRQGFWNTPSVSGHDAAQETIEVQAGEEIIHLGWRGDGPIVHERLHRGPWEYTLLREAGMSPDTRRTARLPGFMRLGQSGPYWSAPRIASVKSGKLRKDIRFEIRGTRGCIRDVASAGSTMSDIVERVRAASAVHLWPSRYGPSDEHDRTSFTLRAWVLADRDASAETGAGTLRYWIDRHDGMAAARLLILLDRGYGRQASLPQ